MPARPLVLVLSLVLAGCSLTGDDASSVSQDDLGQLVVQPEDLPSAFVRFDEGRQSLAESGGNPTRFGRVDGWKARYRRDGTTATRGPLVVASLVDLFESSGGASDHLEALRAERTSAEAGWKPVEGADLGDESVALTVEQGGVRSYVVAWRDGEVTVSVDVNGFDGKLTLADALALAEKQARRISDATG
jgi:hypothetical protein